MNARWAIFGAAMATAGCGVASAERTQAGRAAPEVPVRVARVEHAPATRTVLATGTLRAKREFDLAFKVGGVLRQVTVERGAAVRRGQVLAVLDGTELEAGARQAAEAADKARRDLGRARDLREAGAVAKSTLEDAETGWAVAEATLTTARWNAGQRVILAPEDGWVDARLAEPGEVVAPGRPVLHVTGTDGGWIVRAPLTDRDAVRVRAGDAATVTLDALPERPLAGVVAERMRAAAPGTGTYEIEVKVAPPAGVTFLHGLSAKVRLTREEPGVVTVPLAALTEADGLRGAVYALDGDRARRVPVTIAFVADQGAAVAGDLDAVAEVAAEGALRLADGAHVRRTP